ILRLIATTVRIILRHILQRSSQATHDPAIAARPEDRLPAGVGYPDINLVAEKQVVVRIEHRVRHFPPPLVSVVQILGIVRGSRHARPQRRPHEQAVAPPPQLLKLIAGRRWLRYTNQAVETLPRRIDFLRRRLYEI